MTTPATPPGHGLDVWADVVRAAPLLTPESLADANSSGGTTLVVSAHPDDETIGAGRLLAHWVRSGVAVRAVCLTRGEACLDHLAAELRELDAPATLLTDMAARREAEWHAALDALGVRDRHPYGLPDGGLTDDAALAVLTDFAEGVTTVLAPWPRDPHPDHRAAGRAAARLAASLGARFFSYPVWMTYWADPADADPGLRRVAASAEDDRAREVALAAFVSQLHSPTPGIGPIVPPQMLAHHDTALLHVPTDPASACASASDPDPAASPAPTPKETR